MDREIDDWGIVREDGGNYTIEIRSSYRISKEQARKIAGEKDRVKLIKLINQITPEELQGRLKEENIALRFAQDYIGELIHEDYKLKNPGENPEDDLPF